MNTTAAAATTRRPPPTTPPEPDLRPRSLRLPWLRAALMTVFCLLLAAPWMVVDGDDVLGVLIVLRKMHRARWWLGFPVLLLLASSPWLIALLPPRRRLRGHLAVATATVVGVFMCGGMILGIALFWTGSTTWAWSAAVAILVVVLVDGVVRAGFAAVEHRRGADVGSPQR